MILRPLTQISVKIVLSVVKVLVCGFLPDLDELVQALHLVVIELSEEVSHIIKLLVHDTSIGVDLGEVVVVHLGLGSPLDLAEEVVDLVGNVVADTLLHEVLAVGSLAEHLTDAATSLLIDLGEPVEGRLSSLGVDVVESLTVGGVHVGNEIINHGLGLEENLASAVALLSADLDEEISGIIESLVEVNSLSIDLAEHLAFVPRVLEDGSGGGGKSNSEKSELHCSIGE